MTTNERIEDHGFYACDADLHAQLRRFLGTRAGRKVRYGSLLVDALELDRVPSALDLALARVHG